MLVYHTESPDPQIEAYRHGRKDNLSS